MNIPTSIPVDIDYSKINYSKYESMNILKKYMIIIWKTDSGKSLTDIITQCIIIMLDPLLKMAYLRLVTFTLI